MKSIAKNNNASMSVKEFAKGFHHPDGIYVQSHSMGPLSKCAQDALHKSFISPWQNTGANAWEGWLKEIYHFQGALARLLNGKAQDFCPQTSVSLAFSQYLCALRKANPCKTRKTVLIHQDAFASLGFAIQALCDTYNLNVDILSFDAADMNAWEQRLAQKDVFACLLTHAHSNTGHLSDIKHLCEVAKSNQVFCIVDIAQSVGIIPINLAQWQADCVVGSCVKWVSGGPGAAFLYIRDSQEQTLMPEHSAWFSHANPFEFDIRHFEPHPAALRFWGGTPSIAPFVMASAAIISSSKFGIERLRAHNLELMESFVAGYDFSLPEHYKSLRNSSDKSNEQSFIAHSATLCIRHSADNFQELAKRLAHEKVILDARDNTFRISFGLGNNSDEARFIASLFA